MARKPLKDEIAPVKPHLTRGTGGVAGEVNDVREDLKRCMDRIEEEFVMATDAELHLYADAASGDDNNDGTTAAKAVKTWAKIVELAVFHCTHNVALHLDGTFTDPGTVELAVLADKGINVVVDGGSDLTNVAGPFTADGSSVSSIADSTQTWTTNQYQGYMVQVVGGPIDGETRLIAKNDGTTITPVRNFSQDPTTVGVTFNIVRPTTQFAGSGTLSFKNHGNGVLRVQRLHVTGTVVLRSENCAGKLVFSHVITDATGSAPVSLYQALDVAFAGAAMDPDTFTLLSATTDSYAGLAQRYFAPSTLGCYFRTCEILAVEGSFLSVFTIFKSRAVLWWKGTSATIVFVIGSPLSTINPASFADSSGFGYARSTVHGYSGAPLPGMFISGSSVAFAGGFEVNAPLSHCIQTVNSLLQIKGALQGTGGGSHFGVLAQQGTHIQTQPTAPPTIAGTSGDLSVDGSVQASTWAAIEAGTPVANTSEMVTAVARATPIG